MWVRSEPWVREALWTDEAGPEPPAFELPDAARLTVVSVTAARLTPIPARRASATGLTVTAARLTTHPRPTPA